MCSSLQFAISFGPEYDGSNDSYQDQEGDDHADHYHCCVNRNSTFGLFTVAVYCKEKTIHKK